MRNPFRNRPAGTQSALLFAFVLCGLFFALFSMQPNRLEKVVVADAQQPGFGLIYIADAMGYFEEEGLEVEYKPFELGKDALKDAMEGNSNFATVYETPVVRQIYGGQNVRIVTSLHYATGNTWLVANASHGITAPEQLKGKRIMTSSGTSLEYFLTVLLSNYRVDPESVAITNSDAILSAEAVAAAINEDKIDAVTVLNLSFDTIQDITRDRLVRFTADTYTEISLLVTNAEFIEARPEVAVKFVAALKKAEAFAGSDPESSKSIVRARSKTLTDKDFDEAWSQTELSARIDNYLLSTLESEASFFKKVGTFSTAVPEYRLFIEDRPLKQVSPESVTIF